MLHQNSRTMKAVTAVQAVDGSWVEDSWVEGSWVVEKKMERKAAQEVKRRVSRKQQRRQNLVLHGLVGFSVAQALKQANESIAL